jgi:cobalt-zinc-cadmium efflux system outer membrane protein
VAAHQRDVVQRAERLVGLAAKAWRAGGAELLTLIDAQRAAREAHLAALALAVEARRAETDLLFLTGAEK